MASTPERFGLFELDTPPRIVLRSPGAGVFELTPNGWRPAAWLAARIGEHPREITKQELRRRCRQLLYQDQMPDQGLPQSSRMRSALLKVPLTIWDWAMPPLPYRAPVICKAGASDTAKAAFVEAVADAPDQTLPSRQVERARAGYERQETRVQAIEARSGAFEGYATAVAGLVAIGAALLSATGSTRPSSGWSGYLLLLLLLAAAWCLLVSGFRAYQAAVKRIDWPRPFESYQIIGRARFGGGDAAIALDELAALLLAEERGNFLANWKLERLKQASRFFALALIALLVAALFLLATKPVQASSNALPCSPAQYVTAYVAT
jgi:hypothetical protein